MKKVSLFTVLITLFLLQSCIPLDDVKSLEGEWTCTETSKIFMKSTLGLKGTSVFPVYITEDMLSPNTYYVDNFYQLGTGTQGKITVSGSIVTVPSQIINGIEVVGSGTVSADYNTILITYTADDGGGEVDEVEAEYKR
jgi:hypothetical protein